MLLSHRRVTLPKCRGNLQAVCAKNWAQSRISWRLRSAGERWFRKIHSDPNSQKARNEVLIGTNDPEFAPGRLPKTAHSDGDERLELLVQSVSHRVSGLTSGKSRCDPPAEEVRSSEKCGQNRHWQAGRAPKIAMKDGWL